VIFGHPAPFGVVADGSTVCVVADGSTDGVVADGSTVGVVADGSTVGVVADGSTFGVVDDGSTFGVVDDGSSEGVVAFSVLVFAAVVGASVVDGAGSSPRAADDTIQEMEISPTRTQTKVILLQTILLFENVISFLDLNFSELSYRQLSIW